MKGDTALHLGWLCAFVWLILVMAEIKVLKLRCREATVNLRRETWLGKPTVLTVRMFVLTDNTMKTLRLVGEERNAFKKVVLKETVVR